MKKYLILLTVLILSAFTMNATIPVYDGEDDDPEEIIVERQQNGDGPNSLNQCYIQAYKTSTMLTVNIYNYTGNVSVIVFGLNGSVVSLQNDIFGDGTIPINISSLPEGDYTLFVQAGALFIGDFDK